MAKPSIFLAILAGITQFVQVKMLAPKVKDVTVKDPQTQATQMMNYMFPAFTVFIAWNLPAALPLYWTVTNVITISQQYLIMHSEVEEMEEVKIIKRNTPDNKPKQISKKSKKGRK